MFSVLTFTLPGDLVSEDVDLKDGPEVLEHDAQLVLVHRPERIQVGVDYIEKVKSMMP